MSLAGLIFSDFNDMQDNELVNARTLAAVPFGGRYRIIDFTLSNMATAGIDNIGVIVAKNYLSLTEHIRGGVVWDFDNKKSKLDFLPPYCADNNHGMYKNRINALQTHIEYLKRMKEDHVVMINCNFVANLDLEKMAAFHREHDGMVTAMYSRKPMYKAPDSTVEKFDIDHNGYVTAVTSTNSFEEGEAIGIDCFIVSRLKLIQLLADTLRENKDDYIKDFLQPLIDKKQVVAYEAEETILFLDDASCYLKSNLALLDSEIRRELFQQDGLPIITRARDSAPAKYGPDAVVSNCLLADGVRIEGTVKNSILFRDVVVKKGAVVENSIIMQDAIVGENAHISYVILDNNVVINEGRLLAGYITHPFYVDPKTVI